MNDLDYDSARIVEEIQQGLKHLDEEEENLVVLRDQLTKVKRFREEQARKDDMIATLQERMRQLEYEKEFGTRQSAELEEIMSERILTLERSLAERDEVERQFLEFQVQAEVVEMERDSLKAELQAEKESHDQTRMECTDLVNKIHRLQAALEHDQQVAAKTRMLFEALKTELHKKETELSIAGTRYKQSSQQYKTELAVARKAVEDMAERLILLEEEKNSVESAAHRTKTELDVVHNETAHCQSEVARWASMYAELEKVLSSLKTQISTAQFSHASEVNTLQSEVARWKQDCEKSSAELAAHTSTLSSVVTDMSSITSLQIPTTLTQLHHYRSEVVAIVRSMKRFVNKLPDALPLNTTFRHIASIVDDLSHRTLTYQEALFMSTSSGTQESQRAAELQSRLFKAEQELAQADSSAERMLQMFAKAGFVYALSDKETRGSGGESESSAKGVARVESLNTEYRTKLYEALTLATTTALRQLHTATNDARSLHEKEIAHHDELRAVTEALHSLQSKYNTEMEHMHRMNEEALIAVRVATYESGSEVSRVRDEYNSKYKHNTSELSEQVRVLQAEAEVHQSRSEQGMLCLNHLLAHTAALQHKYDTLHSVYNTLHTVHQKDLKLIRGLDSLASCCNVITTHTTSDHTNTTGATNTAPTHHTNRKHSEVYQFEPFLDPLEEVAVSRAKVTFRVAVLYVLAALRFRRCMREARVHRRRVDDGERSGSDGVQLPPIYVLRESSSTDIARMLLHTARTTTNNHTANANSNTSRVHLHGEMSMDEFDAYLAHYEQEHRSPAGSNRSTSTSGRGGGYKSSLLEVLGSPSRTARSSARSGTSSSAGSGANGGGGGGSGGIYQLHNVSVLYKTLTDMSTTIAKDKAELKQLQTIITSLEDHVRAQEKTLGAQQHHISQARELESHLRRLISDLEHDKRSKSYHVLREIQEELKSDFVSMKVPPVQKYVPLGVTYPQYGAAVSSSAGSEGMSRSGVSGSVYGKDSTVEEDFGIPVDASVIDSNVSAVNHSVDSGYMRSLPRKSPAGESNSVHNTHANTLHNTHHNTHHAHNSHSNSSTVSTSNTTPPRAKLPTSWTATPVDSGAQDVSDIFDFTPMDAHYTRHSVASGSGRGGSNTSSPQHYTANHTHHTTHTHQPTTTHTHPSHESFTYSDLQDTTILDQSIDSIISSALYPPAADISWTQNDSYHTHFTGTDKDIHVSPGHGSGGKGSSGSNGDRGSGGKSREGGGHSGVTGSVLNYNNVSTNNTSNTNTNTVHTNTTNTYSKSTYNSHIPVRTNAQSPARAAQRAHNEEIQAIYSDIGRLGGKLGVKLRSASPSGSSTGSARDGSGNSGYQGRK